ncbi:DUF3422 family protein [uncultured Enterovirga sp.]|uniref:DUF3422 family protein n=1 Tax=uncultured Enterovirga sp. TaxID=2026352 RepID=UPI0035C9C9EA
MRRPPDHPLRAELNGEVHARPPEALRAPVQVSYLALLQTPAQRDEETRCLTDLARGLGLAPPAADANHFSGDLGTFRLRWERHTEYSRYMFVAEGAGSEPFDSTALDRVPEDFIARLPGEVIAASHAEVRIGGQETLETLSRRSFGVSVLIGSEIGGTATTAVTDFRIHAGGFSRFLIADHDLTPQETGRLLQRLLEIDTYKTLALLAFPVSRALTPFLGRAERELAAITTSLAAGREADEATLLGRLTQLEAEIESRGAENHFRFSAAAAYYDLVQQRIGELREARIAGMQTFGEFVERRLAPAMNTCRAAAARQEALAGRVARATQLLSTRIDVTRSEQNQDVLRSMNRRAKLQLRLQETVEGLSIAAVTYYVVGLVSYAVKGLKPVGIDLNPDLAMAASIPVVLLLAAIRIRRIRKSVTDV